MGNYLVVAYQTADSEELRKALLARKQENPKAEFVLLVPATRTAELRRRLDDDRRANAERVALNAAFSLAEAGLRLSRVSIGDESPLVAIQEEISIKSGFYDEIIISTFPADLSRWLSLGIPEKIEATFNLPVHHVYGGVEWVE